MLRETKQNCITPLWKATLPSFLQAMAPKKPDPKADAKKPEPKKPEPKKKREPTPEELALKLRIRRLKIIWISIGISSTLALLVAVSVGVLYYQMISEPEDPLDAPLKELRSAMATSLRRPKLNYENAITVSEEVQSLPGLLKQAETNYANQKLKYQKLFRSGLSKSAEGWDALGENVYYISKGKKTWYEAENFCMARDAHLASILNEEEQKYISSQGNHPVWIGLTDENELGNWQWTDGSEVTKQFWSKGNPTKPDPIRALEPDCVSLVPSAGKFNWKNSDCHDLYHWVCKESLASRAESSLSRKD